MWSASLMAAINRGNVWHCLTSPEHSHLTHVAWRPSRGFLYNLWGSITPRSRDTRQTQSSTYTVVFRLNTHVTWSSSDPNMCFLSNHKSNYESRSPFSWQKPSRLFFQIERRHIAWICYFSYMFLITLKAVAMDSCRTNISTWSDQNVMCGWGLQKIYKLKCITFILINYTYLWWLLKV